MGRPTREVGFSQSAREAQRTSFYAVASCGLLPRTTRPGPRVRTAFWSVASPHPREAGVARRLAVGATFVQLRADQVQDWRVQDSRQVQRVATRLHELVSRSGRIATDQKAVRRRGPG